MNWFCRSDGSSALGPQRMLLKRLFNLESRGNQVMNAVVPTASRKQQHAKHNMALLFLIGCFDCENKVQK